MEHVERFQVVQRPAPGTCRADTAKDAKGCRRRWRWGLLCPTLSHSFGVVALLIGAAVLLSGCGTGTSGRSAHSGPTPNVSATQTVQTEQRGPVTVQVSAQVQGSIAAHTLTLISQVTVTNHTSQLIHLAFACPPPAIDLTLMPEGKNGPRLDVSDLGVDCLLPDVNYAYFDIDPSIEPGSAHTWMLTNVLCPLGSCHLQAGTYVLTAIVASWHQGTIKQFNANAPVLHGSAQGQTVITLE